MIIVTPRMSSFEKITSFADNKLRKYLKDDPNIEIRNIHGTGFLLEDKN
ncbi:hypothetical protein [Maribellus sediminis]|nr:hypothetical protein [Maribellus sediminis]